MVSTPENPDPTQMMGVGSFTAGASVVGDDPNKKIRKPYTITKSRESWTDPEHDKFLEALQLFDRDWKKIEAFVGSKSVIQIRSHAQKYFLKAQKSGAGEHLPPPRPKRKAAHPYPQKASKNVPVIAQVAASFQPSPVLSEPVFMRRPDPSPVVRASVANTGLSHPADQFVPTGGIPHATKVLPDFAQVYGFIGSVFDPCTTDHLQNLKKMDAIDVETVLLLMRNLSVNLTSPDFDEHKRLLSSYEIDSDKNESSGLINNSSDDQSGVAEHYV